MLRHAVPAVGWTVAVAILCLLPGKDLPEVRIVHFDKLLHLGAFGLLNFLHLRWERFRALQGQGPASFLRITLAVALYGGLLELLQGALYTDRYASWADAAANAAGAMLAVLFVRRA